MMSDTVLVSLHFIILLMKVGLLKGRFSNPRFHTLLDSPDAHAVVPGAPVGQL